MSKILDCISSGTKDGGIIRVGYSRDSMDQVKKIEQFGINDQAVSRKYEEGISIDGADSKDLDDAIWAERTSKGYAIFVHIADVTEAIPIYSAMDQEALCRTTSIYRRDGVLNMFHPIISQDLMSLNENGKKLTLSMEISLDHDGNMYDFHAYESVFKNKKRYDYEDFVDDYLNPDSENHETLQLMYEIAGKRKAIRKKGWATMDYDESDRQVSLDEKQERPYSFKKAIPTTIIEEFMVLANIASAIIAVRNAYDSVFRLHDSNEERARYSNVVWLHAGLALSAYGHFTSPIRRYPDMVVHRVLKLLHIRWEQAPYTKEEIGEIAHHVNFQRTVIEASWRHADHEVAWANLISRLRETNGETLNISHFTGNIRESVGNGKKMPRVVVEEIIRDLENGDRSDWAWAIGVLLVSGDHKIRQYLKKALLDDRKFPAKSVLAILNNTRVLLSDEHCLFEITEIGDIPEEDFVAKESWIDINDIDLVEGGDYDDTITRTREVQKTVNNEFSIEVKYKGELLFRNLGNSGKYSAKYVVGMLRNKMLGRIVEHFCGK